MSSLTKNMEQLLVSLPNDYQKALLSDATWELDFKNEEKYWYSPFILWGKDEVENYQPDYDSDFSSLLAIGSNGGGETYFLNMSDNSINVCDLIVGIDSLERVAANYTELLSLLSDNSGQNN
ncbi:SMI1/KNR4 family protein [Agarivorans sp. QJM3NY_25]|uniref:SMI1/KNR4 family protein n=1 Tax=Agarivorans sp. QJM3NY_25 TaxID=3421430 RepID=UPI003D7C526B